MGEPFLNKSTIDMLEILDEKGITAMSVSNGSVMTEELTKRQSNLKHTSVFFSMDGGTKNTFEGIRIKGNFEKVTNNIKKLINNSPDLHVALWVVLFKKNIEECEAIVNTAKELGVSEVIFQPFISNWGKEDMEEKINSKSPNPKKAMEYFDKALQKGKETSVLVKYFRNNLLTIDKPCEFPWTSMFIGACGNVIPCCILADSDTLNFGNIFEENIRQIWNSNKYKSFRKMHKNGKVPDICKTCYQLDDSHLT